MIVLALALLALAPVEPVSKAMTSLAQRTDASSFICIGTVDEVITVPSPEGAAGGGIMRILGRKDGEYVHCFASSPSMAHPDEPYTCRWKPVLEYVETLAQFSAESVTLLAQRWNQPGSFDLRVLPDGRRRFASPGPEESEVVTVDR